MKRNLRRGIPAVNAVLEAVGDVDLPRLLVKEAVRRELAVLRRGERALEFDAIVERVRNSLRQLARSRLQPLINGTGVIIHTNFGRAPLGVEAVGALSQIAASYNNLEYDITHGTRGRRGEYVDRALAVLCCAEAATVVNNCAAALVLITQHFTRAKPEVIISRGELVQIGGGFRIAEILEASGATLREVGATNKTALNDYARAIGPRTAIILRVHRSNFFMGGFVASPSSAELGALAKKKRIPFVEDLGSGAMMATEKFGLAEHEPTPAETLRAGADLVCFSGDKLFGGPQAGIIAGQRRFISALKREPLFRALRCDKLILAALQATTELHLAKHSIPILNFLNASLDELRQRAQKIAARFRNSVIEVGIEQTRSQIGGGALPRSQIESVALALQSKHLSAGEIAARARSGVPPIIGYLLNDAFKIDLRTIFASQDEQLVQALHGLAELGARERGQTSS